MTNQNQWKSYSGYIGVDWGDKEHALCMRLRDGQQKECKLSHSPEAIRDWAEDLRKEFPGGRFAVSLEQSRGSTCTALLEHSDILDLYPVNPLTLHFFRKTWSVGGAKDDPSDARLICEMMCTHPDRMRLLRDRDPQTERLGLLNEKRRKLVDMRTKTIEQLISQLKEYFPQALALTGQDFSTKMSCEFLQKWDSLQDLKRARSSTITQFYYRHNCRSKKRIEERLTYIQSAVPLTTNTLMIETMALMVRSLVAQISLLNEQIKKFDELVKQTFRECEDAALFSSFPGAGPALAPRLLAVFGSDRSLWSGAEEIQKYSGVAPVVKRSGSSCKITRRYARPRFDHQSFVEFARCSKRYSPWAAAYYAMKKSQGMGHNAIVRSLAFKWIRIMYACWKKQVPYDDESYLKHLQKLNSPCLNYLQAPV